MAQVIHKHVLTDSAVNTLLLCEGAQILKVGVQANSVCLWERHEVGAPAGMVKIQVHLAATGEEYEELRGEYLDTVFELGGRYVWHVYVTREECTDVLTDGFV